MDIKTYVEQRFPLLEQDSALEYSRNAMIHSKQIGLTHGLEIAKGFVEWADKNYSRDSYTNEWRHGTMIPQTTEDILSIYLDTFKTK